MNFEIREMIFFAILAILWGIVEAWTAFRRRTKPWNFVPNQTPGCFMMRRKQDE